MILPPHRARAKPAFSYCTFREEKSKTPLATRILSLRIERVRGDRPGYTYGKLTIGLRPRISARHSLETRCKGHPPPRQTCAAVTAHSSLVSWLPRSVLS